MPEGDITDEDGCYRNKEFMEKLEGIMESWS
jgi:hypothetical protein